MSEWNQKLDDYFEKRNFNISPEPQGMTDIDSEEPIFVIQKHNARRLHYDFRLESDGVLKSWAVPKGPSLDPKEKRLAVETEDHPMDYAAFEGVIPRNNYGAGEVIVWDVGTFVNTSEKNGKKLTLEEAYQKGHITVWLNGQKLKGGFALIRTSRSSDKSQWLLMKMKDQKAAPTRDPVLHQPTSILSGRTIEDLQSER